MPLAISRISTFIKRRWTVEFMEPLLRYIPFNECRYMNWLPPDFVMKHIHPLLGNDREQTIKQWPLLGNGLKSHTINSKRTVVRCVLCMVRAELL
jgi:hypothetical protein